MTLNVEGRPTGQGVISEGSNWFVNWADIPALVVLDNGDWVAFWLERNDPDMPEGYDIRVVRSIDRGKTWSSPMSPHRDGTKTQHGFVSMIADGEDRVLMSWLDGRRAADAAAGATSHAAHDHESAPMTLRSAVIDRAGNITRIRDRQSNLQLLPDGYGALESGKIDRVSRPNRCGDPRYFGCHLFLGAMGSAVRCT
jgi:hypothetical protein